MSSVNEVSADKAEEYVERVGFEFREDCFTKKDPEACHRFAEFLNIVKKDKARSAELFLSTCKEMKFGESCLALGNFYLAGRGGITKDVGKALELYDTACAGGSVGGCNNAGLVWQNGFNGTLPDLNKAVNYFEKSCDGKFRNGCFNLSALYLQGKGTIEKDMLKALEYAVKSCDLGHPWGCANASRIYQTGDGVPVDEKLAKQYRSRAKKLSKAGT